MAKYTTLGTYSFTDQGDAAHDIRGSHVYGKDHEKLGKIDDVIYDERSGSVAYAVVDTGGWLSSKKFVVPAREIRPSTEDPDEYRVDLTKQQIESFPAYDSRDVESDDRWNDYENRYRSQWETGPVMHRKETDHNITPTTQQMTTETGSTGRLNWDRSQAEQGTGAVRETERINESARDLSTRIVPPGADVVEIDNTATGIGARWLNFEARLRDRRKQGLDASIERAKEEDRRDESEFDRKRRAS
ncbi:MAG TPA: PRC-barrel domain-containing protein [Terriglobales bacterium]|jgi:sporulation protein YlmC with PRC-barrel domain|nr:PRC-barrel domain-containing protein [Terriglobales bacterium]